MFHNLLITSLIIIHESVNGKRFIMIENTKLVNEQSIKSVPLKLDPAECLGECLYTSNCKSFNVYIDLKTLNCDLFEPDDGKLEYSSNTMYFTVNMATARIPPTSATTSSSTLTANITPTAISATQSVKKSSTSTRKTTKALNEIFIVANLSTPNCVFSNLSFAKPSFAGECQIFKFGSDMTLQLTKATQQTTSYCLRRYGTTVIKTNQDCSQFNYNTGKKQFELTIEESICIEFHQYKEPVANLCHPSRSYEKVKWDEDKIDSLMHI